jgi:hypothetical protein
VIPQRAVPVVLSVLIVVVVAVGAVASLAFILACWLGFRQAWGLPLTLVFGGVIWLLVVWLPRWMGHLPW